MKRHLHPIGDKENTIWEKICSTENLMLAHKNAKKGKGWYKEVKMVDDSLEFFILWLQILLKSHTYKTSEYNIFTKIDNGKKREIYKLPYYPDRICQWAVLQVIEPIILRNLISNTYSAIPNRGIHKALNDIKKDFKKDIIGTKYCLKLDIKKYYPSIDHNILKEKYRKIFKDKNLLWLLDEIIESVPEEKGIPIGNYLSQYSGNFYLSSFDHWIKENKKVKYYYRYMDDIVILSNSKDFLHSLLLEIMEYMQKNLKLTVKSNWQVFPVDSRGLDFVGYRIFHNYCLLRKSICKNIKIKTIKIKKKIVKKNKITYSEWCTINSYRGWLMHCDSYRLNEKYIKDLSEYLNKYYQENIKKED